MPIYETIFNTNQNIKLLLGDIFCVNNGDLALLKDYTNSKITFTNEAVLNKEQYALTYNNEHLILLLNTLFFNPASLVPSCLVFLKKPPSNSNLMSQLTRLFQSSLVNLEMKKDKVRSER